MIDLTSKTLLGWPSGSVHGTALLLELDGLLLELDEGGVPSDELLPNDGALELLSPLLLDGALLLD